MVQSRKDESFKLTKWSENGRAEVGMSWSAMNCGQIELFVSPDKL